MLAKGLVDGLTESRNRDLDNGDYFGSDSTCSKRSAVYCCDTCLKQVSHGFSCKEAPATYRRMHFVSAEVQ